MSNKRFIVVKDGTGKKLYEGEDNRTYNQDYPKCALGIPIRDWVKAAIYIIGLAILFSRMQVQLEELIKISGSFKEYMESSDNWHSSQFGTRFKGGAPVDSTFNTKGRDKLQ